MPRARNGAIELEYDTFGRRTDRPLLLVMGLGAQMIVWREGFCEQLAEAGHYVVRFDNRDVGLSTKLDEHGVPSMLELAAALMRGERPQVPYTLDDMADDAIAVLDAEGIGRAHVCGASLGGMVVQAMAIRHPARLMSMTSIMSTTGNPELPRATPEAMAVLTAPPATTREESIERSVRSSRVIGSQTHIADPDEVRAFAAQAYDRSFYPVGVARQMAAATAHGNRRAALESVQLPTLVLHGREDPLIPVSSGIDTWQAIAGADLLVLAGMGHDMPKPLWPRITRAISDLTNGAELTARAS